MSGILLPLHTKTPYSFTVAQFPSSQSLAIPIAVNVNVTPWREATLIARVHGAPTWTTNAQFQYDFFPSGPCSDDPSVVFRGTTGNPTLTVTTANVGSSTAYVKSANVTSGLAGFGDLILTLTQPASAGSYIITLSCDLIVKA